MQFLTLLAETSFEFFEACCMFYHPENRIDTLCFIGYLIKFPELCRYEELAFSSAIY